MRITTRAVFQMTHDGFKELERKSYDYTGPVAHAGGGDSGGDSQQTSKPWKKLQPYVLDSAKALGNAAGQPNEYYGGDTVQGFTPWQTQGQEGMAGYAGSEQLNNMIGNQQGAVNFGMTGGTVDPNQNSALGMSGNMYNQFSNYGNDPALQNAGNLVNQSNSMVNDPYSDPTIAPWINAAINPITENYQENVLPGIRDQAEMYGGAGNRTGLAEGVAARGYMDTVGDVSAGMYNQAFGRGLNQQQQSGQQLTNAYGQAAGNQMGAAGQYGQNYGQGMTAATQMTSMAPQAMNAGMAPWQMMQNVGGQQQAMGQMEMDANRTAYDYNRDADFNRQQAYYSTMAGTPWGTSTSSGGDPGGTSVVSGAAGGAMSGAALGAMTGTPFGVGAGALGGAAIGGAMSIWG
jgi:hypothetical protein